MSEDSYWDLDEVTKAICVTCHEKTPKGYLWKGTEYGYGEHKIECSICGKVINEETKTSS